MARRSSFQLWSELAAREAGGGRAAAAKAYAVRRQARQLRLSGGKMFERACQGGVNWMDLDKVESRYLLVGGTDTTVAAYDTHCGGAAGEGGGPPVTMQPLFALNRRSHPAAHKFMISCVAWYPVDSGMFVTGSYDNGVKVWDTNQLEVVAEWALPAKVSNVAMSGVAAAHCLVAAAILDPHVRLCDPTSGAITHVFSGHREAVWSVAWSTYCEYEVVSGDAGGQIRIWDIRRAGCRCILDQHATRPQRAAALLDELPPVAPPPSKKFKRGGAAAGQGAARVPAAARQGAAGSAASQYVAPSVGLSEAIVRAHGGAVTCILPCPDGLHLLTAATDGRMRLWDACFRHNKLVTFEGTYNRAIRGRQLAVTDDSRLVFYPSGSSIEVFDVLRGDHVHGLQQGHTESINCCMYNPALQELYSGANDSQVLAWQCAPDPAEEGT